MTDKKVVCFGEVLWDVFPAHKKAGGAPMNVAFHLNNFGIGAEVISRVGVDTLGEELLKFLHDKNISTRLIQKDATMPTSIVKVELDKHGSAEYEIVQPVAWDFIALTEEGTEAVRNADIFVFGSLASRNGVSKQTLLRLLEIAHLKVFDVNLRAPYYSKELLEDLLAQADYIKMNDEELDEIVSWYDAGAKTEAEKLHFAKEKFGLNGVIVTKGKDGVVYLDNEGLYSQAGFPIKVKDTVGSGDSFLAAFLSKILEGSSPPECLEFAAATGALVATMEGGTPKFDKNDVLSFIQSKVN